MHVSPPMSKSTALRALVFLVLAASAAGLFTLATGAAGFSALATSAAGQPVPEEGVLSEQGVPPEHGVLYAREPFSGALTARTREVLVRVEAQQGGDDEFPRYVLHVETADGRSARHPWPDDPFQPDELYLLDGYACDQDLIDVVVRNAPPKYGDVPFFSYIRFLIDEETLDLMALVPYDPSVEAASGVAPIQSVTAPGGIWPVFSVDCGEGGVESVSERDER